MENESISKAIEEALKKFEAKTNQVPLGYFDQFELDLMQKIKSDAELPKKALIFPLFSNQKKYLIAASLLLVVATVSLFLEESEKNTATIAKVNMIAIETLPDEAIETYVYENEPMAEVEWNTAIEATGSSIVTTNQ